MINITFPDNTIKSFEDYPNAMVVARSISEGFARKFPLWLAPVQAVVLPINNELAPYGEKIKQELESHGLRCEIDTRAESLKKKIRPWFL